MEMAEILSTGRQLNADALLWWHRLSQFHGLTILPCIRVTHYVSPVPPLCFYYYQIEFEAAKKLKSLTKNSSPKWFLLQSDTAST